MESTTPQTMKCRTTARVHSSLTPISPDGLLLSFAILSNGRHVGRAILYDERRGGHWSIQEAQQQQADTTCAAPANASSAAMNFIYVELGYSEGCFHEFRVEGANGITEYQFDIVKMIISILNVDNLQH